jgi:hypothetical protein
VTDLDQRWRLVLGRYAEQRFPRLSGTAADMDQALGFLYDRLYQGRGLRGDDPGADRSAGLEASAPHVVGWLDQVNRLFPDEVFEALTTEAVDRFGLTEVLTNPDALERIHPDIETLKLLMSIRSAVPDAVLSAVRRVVRQVVDELTEKLRADVQAVLTGRVNRQNRTRRPTGALDPLRTIETNLGTWDEERQRLLIEHVTFFNRTKIRYPWDIVLCVDQSGSMLGSVIHSAVLAGILAGLPGVNVRLVVFDTAVVDLSHLTDDPVETLMSVQLGGGTDIGQAVAYCEQLVTNPARTIFALITDFYEGGSISRLLQSVQRLAESGVTTMGLAALDDGTGPAFDRNTAEKVVAAGMPVAAMTPKSFAQWAAEVMQ